MRDKIKKISPYKWMEDYFGIKLKWYQKELINIITICDIKNLPIKIRCKRKGEL